MFTSIILDGEIPREKASTPCKHGKKVENYCNPLLYPYMYFSLKGRKILPQTKLNILHPRILGLGRSLCSF